MAEKKFKYDSIQDRESILQYLEALTEGFRQGSLTFVHKEKKMLFSPQKMIGFSVKAEANGDERKLSLKFTWKEEEEKNQEEEPLLIQVLEETTS